MAAVIGMLIDGYRTINDDWSDPRLKGWPLCGHLWIPIGIVSLYNYFVLKWGPEFMEKRKPFNVDRIMIVYNIIQIVLCSWVTIEAFKMIAWSGDFNWMCEPIDYGDNPKTRRIIRMVWVYYMLKILDLLDTVFIILRKKFNQASFLHIYHHSGMVGLGYVGTNFIAGGHGMSLGLLNNFVHAVMYSYYLLSALRPEYKRSNWMKKKVTQLQMIQFFMLILHFSLPFFQPNCNYPLWICFIILPQYSFMLVLFADFYRKAYGKKVEPAKTQ
ncbi:unnamed protein product [Bemisia tabaci]|uniref:Elongation of very long chain fatty acids protein n=1 Tax=Bemisia tabaci TaxID=7038 RepID=A0A9P0AIE9_BEMTA|nr:PREDICTED: elongation of very long chain fatty acids protein 7-like [Bemisia tabaci]CAH0391946.1 unnamed protein product [Bemisia tabaci]